MTTENNIEPTVKMAFDEFQKIAKANSKKPIDLEMTKKYTKWFITKLKTLSNGFNNCNISNTESGITIACSFTKLDKHKEYHDKNLEMMKLYCNIGIRKYISEELNEDDNSYYLSSLTFLSSETPTQIIFKWEFIK